MTLPALLLALALPAFPAPNWYELGLELAIQAQEDPGLWRGIWQVECGGEAPCARSRAGACCPLQVLGGRYGNPPCAALEGSPWLCIVTADRQMERCKRMCGKARAVDCYHDGGCDADGTYSAAVAAKRRSQ